MKYKWWKSPNRLLYIYIATKHFTTPKAVAYIAHGFKLDHRNGAITDDLIRYKILNQKVDGEEETDKL